MMKRRTFIAALAALLIPCFAFGAAPTEYYVDPSIAAASGSGTIGDPYGDLQHALDTITQDTTNGDRVNVKAGTAESLAATLNLTTYGTPTAAAPLIIQGYTSAADDGGYGVIDGAGSYGSFSGTQDYIFLKNMECRNSGAAVTVNLDRNCLVEACVFSNNTAGLLRLGERSSVFSSHFSDGSSYGVLIRSGTVEDCHFENGTKDFNRCIWPTPTGATIRHNSFNVDGATDCVLVGGPVDIIGNSFLSSSGTGAGILYDSAIRHSQVIANNIFEGFSGVGGTAIDFASATVFNLTYANNAFYNNTSNETNKPTGRWLNDTDNESLGSSAFAKSGSNTFANRHTYYKPLDVGNVYNGAWPSGINTDKGAVQHVYDTGTHQLVLGASTWIRPTDPIERTLDLVNYTWLGPITEGGGGTTIIIIDD